MKNSWNQTLITQVGSGAALSSSTTPTSLLAAAAKFPMAGTELQVGDKLIIRAGGNISTAGSSPGTFTFDVRFGSVIVANGGASPTLVTSASNLTWDLEMGLTVQSIGGGTSATVLGRGRLLSAALSAGIQLLPASSPAAGTGFDSVTNAFTIDLFGTWSVSNASNSITCTDFELVYCN